MKRSLLFFCIFLSLSAAAQSPATLKVRAYGREHENNIINEFVTFLSIPNIAVDSSHLRDNANFIMEMMKRRGIKEVQLLSPATKTAPPSVYGEVIVPGAKKTLIFYAHYDGQPVNPAEWAKELEPFHPQLVTGVLDHGGTAILFPEPGNFYKREWRIYGRSASDDKAGVFVILQAYETIMKNGMAPSCNLKFFFEGEEEAGSPHLHEILSQYRSLLQSDLWIICDGPVHQSGKKQIVFGVRGDTHLDLTVYGSKRPLHSGHYGNWAPNPAMMLVKLLASMKDDKGKILIKGFYDDVIPLTEAEKRAFREIPSVDEQLKNELGIIAPETPGRSLEEAINLPSLNLNGIQSGNVGKLATNVIPTSATTVLDLRLVPGNDWQRQQQKVVDHIRRQGYYITDHEPTDEERKKYPRLIKVIPGKDGYNAQRTSMDLPIAKDVIAAIKSTTAEQVVLLPGAGGSLPLFLFEKYLQAKTITVPIANHDNNQHAANENIRLQNLWDGIESMAALMLMK